MDEIFKRMDDISSSNTNHYLIKAREQNSSYFDDFIETANILKLHLTQKEFEFWCTEKMLLKAQPFNEKAFIQSATETAVARYFGEKYPANFKVEAKINPNNDKDVDCQFTDAEFTFNIEVKCSDYISKEKIDLKDAFKYVTVGRLADRGKETKDTISKALNEGLEKLGKETKPHLDAKNMDNNLKDFLESAHDKVNPTPNENEVNILIVGCDDENDIQNWVSYLWADEGLFTADSFADKLKYENVDLVVFTNQYFKHNKFFDKNVKHCWSLESGFNLIFCNPFRKMAKEKGIKHFISLFPDFSEELAKYKVPGGAPSYVKDSVRVRWFVKDNLEKQQNKYLFEEK